MSNILLLHVNDPAVSVEFYSRVLGRAPVEQSPTFALFVLASGLALGLWRRDGVKPESVAEPGASDLGFKVDAEGVERMHAAWREMGVEIAMPPTEMDFGRSFVARDPDGHRLRVYALAEEAEG